MITGTGGDEGLASLLVLITVIVTMYSVLGVRSVMLTLVSPSGNMIVRLQTSLPLNFKHISRCFVDVPELPVASTLMVTLIVFSEMTST